jgi:hypothetical protein
MAMSESNVSSVEQEFSDLVGRPWRWRVLSAGHLRLLSDFASSSQAEGKDLSLDEEEALRKAFEFLASRPPEDRDTARRVLEWTANTVTLEFFSREVVELLERLPPARRLYTVWVLLHRFAEERQIQAAAQPETAQTPL